MITLVSFPTLLTVSLTVTVNAMLAQVSPPPVPSPTLVQPRWLPDVFITAPWETGLAGPPLAATRADTSLAAQARVQDSAALLRNVPGAAVVRNGPLTGLVQLRGLSGDRVDTRVNGMSRTPACPNHMDPPLHYAAPSSVDRLVVIAGISPVSLGGDSPGGTVLVDSPAARFASGTNLLWFGDLGSHYQGGNDGYGFSGAGGVASQRFSGAYQGAWETGNDYSFPGGRVRDTGFETQQHDWLSAARVGQGVLSVAGGLTRTHDAGTPALPMDMIRDNAWHVGTDYDGTFDWGTVESGLYYHTIDHLMDNYSLRPLAAGAVRMQSPATSDDWGWLGGVTLPRGQNTFRVGTGFHRNDFAAWQQNVTTGKAQTTLTQATRNRIGTYAEWQSDWSSAWSTLLGVRNDTVLSDAGDVTQWFAPNAAEARAFNAQSHQQTDPDFDLVGTVQFAPARWSTFELALARKQRAPSLIERYLWTPLSASAGQADGRTYLGNLGLVPETSYQVAGTADFHGDQWQMKVTPFYNSVQDYMQGLPISRMVAGQPVLQWQNLPRAELYGVDGSARYAFTKHFGLSGSFSYVRGRDPENDDNLYRIAPLRGTVGADFALGGWTAAAEVVLVAAQNQVAAYNNEQPTPGYTLLNLRAGYAFRWGLSVEAGVENLTNELYADHLGGINRVSGSDVAVNQHLPGAGRFGYFAARIKF